MTEYIYYAKGFMSITNIGDSMMLNVEGKIVYGLVTAISQRGVNIKNEVGVKFYKWCHVRSLTKNELTTVDIKR